MADNFFINSLYLMFLVDSCSIPNSDFWNRELTPAEENISHKPYLLIYVKS